VRDRPRFSAYFDTIIRGQERHRAGEESIWSSGVAVPIDSTDGTPDISLELGSGRVDRIPEVELVGQLGEGGQECLDGGIGTSGSEVLKPSEYFFHGLGKLGTHGKSKGDDTRKDVRASTSSLPADRATPIVSRMVRCISTPTGADSRGKTNEPNANGFVGYIGVFEDTRQVANKITHRGRTLDIARMT